MSKLPQSHAVLPFIEALLHGFIDDAGFAQLQAILLDDVEARSLYRSYANLHAAIPGIVGQAPRLSLQITDADGDALLSPHEMPHDQLVSLLAQVEDKGKDLDPMAIAAERFPMPTSDALSKQDWLNAGRYILSRADDYRQQIIMGAAAAVMLLAAVLFLVLSQPSETKHVATKISAGDMSGQRSESSSIVPVATLTAARDAQWESDIDFGTPEPGQSLFAEQRLVLTRGFAEITTNRGAVALIQAPATIEMLISDNAVYLHEGKLVGACRTAASKGFLVATRHADIVDVGTEFAAEVSNQGVTATVFTGSVEVTPAGGDTQTVVANQTARLMVRGNTRELQVESRVAEGFTRLLPRPALVTAATINDDRFRVEIVPQGVIEDAKLFTDREHEINGLDRDGIPSILLGGDIVRTPADARPEFHDNTETLAITLELAAPADVYLLFGGPQEVLPSWIEMHYEPTAIRVGMDFGELPKLGKQPTLGVGPGVSIDREMQVWKRKTITSGRAIVAGPMQENFTYTLVAVSKPQRD